MKDNGYKLLFLVLLCWIASLPHSAMAKDYIYVPVSNALQIIDCETDTVVKTVPAYNDYIVTSAPSPDGKRYYLNAQHSIYVFDTATNELVDTYRFSSDLNRVTVLGFAVSEDNSRLFLSSSIVKKKQNIPRLNVLPPQLIIFDIHKKTMIKNYPIPYCVLGVITLKNDPEHLILIGLDIYKLNLSDGKVEKVMGLLNPEEGEEPKNSMMVWNTGSPKDHGIFTNPYYTPTGMGYLILDRNTGELRKLKGEDVWFEYSTIVSPDKKYLYGVMDELVKVDMETGKTVKSVPVEKGTCYTLSMTSDGKKLYVGPAGPDITVYNADTLERLGVIPLEADGVQAHRLSF